MACVPKDASEMERQVEKTAEDVDMQKVTEKRSFETATAAKEAEEPQAKKPKTETEAPSQEEKGKTEAPAQEEVQPEAPVKTEAAVKVEPKQETKVELDRTGTIRKQIEYYLSNDNLKTDKFFQTIIKQSEGGFVGFEHFLNCRKISSLKATADELMKACEGSDLLTVDEKQGIAREGNPDLPELVKKEQFKKQRGSSDSALALHMTSHSNTSPLLWFGLDLGEKKDEVGSHPAIKTAFIAAMKKQYPIGPKPEIVWTYKKGYFEDHPTMINVIVKRNQVKNIEALEGLVFTMQHKNPEGEEIKMDLTLKVLDLEVRKKMWDLAPTYLRTNKEWQKEMKHVAQKKPKLVIPDWHIKYDSMNHLKAKIKEVLMSHSMGEIIPPDSKDYEFLMALMKQHPDRAAKLEGLKELLVNCWETDDRARCLFIVKQDGSKDPVSLNKCCLAIMAAAGAAHEAEIRKQEEKMKAKEGTVSVNGEVKKEEAKVEVKEEAAPVKEEAKEGENAKPAEKKETPVVKDEHKEGEVKAEVKEKTAPAQEEKKAKEPEAEVKEDMAEKKEDKKEEEKAVPMEEA